MYEKIIQEVIRRLHNRAKSELTLSVYDTDLHLTEHLFLEYASIHLQDVDAGFFLRFLNTANVDDWTVWIRKAIIYGVEISFTLVNVMEQAIPFQQLIGYPFRFYTKAGERVVYLPGKVISYRQIAMLPQQAGLILGSDQLLTPLARDELEKHHRKWIERL
ncbi:PduM family microcompartment protein [Bacillaceae bacterium Marseille-Q3522]|nr:PduM family microcompartment protein [Bacillaceae bacterium Marseille-Q3522]